MTDKKRNEEVTVEKIGGTSMSAFNAVMRNIIMRPDNPYGRVFVVSAYGGITDGLLESKRDGAAGIYQLIANREEQWPAAFDAMAQRMTEINHQIFSDISLREQADTFIQGRLAHAKSCIENLLSACQYQQFNLRHNLPQIREFLAALGEVHSAFNLALLSKSHHINAVFVDLSGWQSRYEGSLKSVIAQAFETIDLSESLPIVTGYAYCKEGLMKTYDRGYSEMTFSGIACHLGASQAIIHKEYHLSSADPCIVGPEYVRPIGETNFDVADQLANLGMEAIHPNAASGLREKNISLRIKNTFEPEHPGTLITGSLTTSQDKIEIIAGKRKVYALHIFDQSMVGQSDAAGYELMEIIADASVDLLSKEMTANSITYYLSGSSKSLNSVLTRAEKCFPTGKITGTMVAMLAVVGARIDTNRVLSEGVSTLVSVGIAPIAVQASMRNVSVQFVVKDGDYNDSLIALHRTFFPSTHPETARQDLQPA